jgi:hypothetical protein
MADLIALKQSFTYRQNQVTITANPALQPDDQVIITERMTGEGYIHRITSISSDFDNDTGRWTYTLTTNWLGTRAFTRLAWDPEKLTSRDQGLPALHGQDLMFTNDYFADRERWNSQTQENSARGAWAWGSVHSKGWGEIVVEDPIMFDISFVHQPIVAYGFALDDDDQVVDGRLPRCSGGVLRWVTTPDGYFIGAYVFVTVATADPMLASQAWIESSLEADPPTVTVPDDYTDDPGYDITHSLMFSALAIKGALG